MFRARCAENAVANVEGTLMSKYGYRCERSQGWGEAKDQSRSKRIEAYVTRVVCCAHGASLV
jgi:hypothetical protein